ncbi:hypothetical protein [Brunnivagina elsteri]|uniref:Uncharacterized protein n=1 Tax=Brunnivagina elsteri CCALA 953 TaxID=987040 RepID=A0A2A2TLU4_9CYAN|nr:hypothetical protein [Calothrix elsteri]PAX57212.1 hypothetical protein CK510_09025 [Calothrix elsteri CCALA 953]
MGRYSNIAVSAIMVMAIAGCSSDSGQQASNPTSTPGATPTPSATTAANPSTSTTPGLQPFNNPVIAGKQQQEGGVVAIANPNLIQPTDATQRFIAISKGRTDPFAQIVSPPLVRVVTTGNFGIPPRRPVPVVPPLPSGVQTVSIRPQNPFRPRSAVISSRIQVPIPRTAIAKLPKPNRGFTPVLPRLMPQVVPNPSLVSVLPPTPQPELARAVFVSGVVSAGREPQAIIKVPNEPTSRYVQAGDRLSNGLLVKRIEMNEGSDPIVIFEQFGIEVARMVGEGAAAPSTTASAEGAVPPPPSSVPTGAS